jgi:hypothetical protein
VRPPLSPPRPPAQPKSHVCARASGARHPQIVRPPKKIYPLVPKGLARVHPRPKAAFVRTNTTVHPRVEGRTSLPGDRSCPTRPAEPPSPASRTRPAGRGTAPPRESGRGGFPSRPWRPDGCRPHRCPHRRAAAPVPPQRRPSLDPSPHPASAGLPARRPRLQAWSAVPPHAPRPLLIPSPFQRASLRPAFRLHSVQ